jgi:hypothetical protein
VFQLLEEYKQSDVAKKNKLVALLAKPEPVVEAPKEQLCTDVPTVS